MIILKINSRNLLIGALYILVVIAYIGLYIFGALRQLREVNVSPGFIDQDAYMLYAKKLYKFHSAYPGERNRMPVYPSLQALFFDPSEHRKSFFESGKYRNLYLSVFLLASIAIIFHLHFSRLHTLNSMLIIGFTVFIFKAGWFQAELLFYFLTFGMFYLMWQLLRKPTIPRAVLAGLLAGMAHLTKASILPGLVIFLIVAAIDQGLRFLRNLRQEKSYLNALRASPHLLIVPIVALIFLASVYPYIRASKKLYGSYFYNVNSTFYIWYDSWEDASQGTKAHGDREGWPDMPAEDIPSLGKYLRDHTLNQIVLRIVNGARAVFMNAYYSYGYFKYMAFYVVLFLGGVLVYRKQATKMLHSNIFPILFVCLYFSAYLLLYSWYAPVADGNRFILAQFLPLLFMLSLGLQAVLGDVNYFILRKKLPLLTAVNYAITGVLLIDIYFILTDRIVSLMGGT